MSKIYKIKKGLDIKINGLAKNVIIQNKYNAEFYSIFTNDFLGITPVLNVEIGDKIKRGNAVFFDKKNPTIKITAPCSGEIYCINRNEKRAVTEIVIKADKNNEQEQVFENYKKQNSIDEIKEIMLEAGVWTFIRQRPFNIIADPNKKPRDIFITFFDSAPLATNYDFILKNYFKEINIALQKLSLLTEGKIWLNFKNKSESSQYIDNKDNYNINYFEGPHPSSLNGLHINKLKPINKNEIVWTLNAADLIIIGKLFLTGEYDPIRIIPIAGSNVLNPIYYEMKIGANISDIIKYQLKNDNSRIISGNVLTGTNITENPCLKHYDTLVSIIPEGNKYEMFGWILPGFKKYSISYTFISKLLKPKQYDINTNIHGGKRPYVVTNEYPKVFPYNIYIQQLIKAILAKDIDKMEQLGIYEIVEEDVALCEFVCTSKINVQDILREGINMIINEIS